MRNKKLAILAICTVGASGISACSSMPTETEMAVTPVVTSQIDQYEKGKRYFKNGLNGLALVHFKRATERNPEDVASLNAVAITYQRLNRPDMADKYFRQALLLDVNSGQTLNNLGFFHFTEGNIDLALTYFEAARKDPEYKSIAEANLKLATLKIEEKVKVSKAALKVKEEKLQPPIDAGSVSLERMSKSVYVLNTKENRVYEKAVVHLKMDPRLIIRNAYTK